MQAITSSGMTPQQHVERAEALVAVIDAKFTEGGESKARWGAEPVHLALAMAHLELAQTKIMGERR